MSWWGFGFLFEVKNIEIFVLDIENNDATGILLFYYFLKNNTSAGHKPIKWIKMKIWKGGVLKKNHKFVEIFFEIKNFYATLQGEQKLSFKKLRIFKIKEGVCMKVLQALTNEFYYSFSKSKLFIIFLQLLILTKKEHIIHIPCSPFNFEGMQLF